MQTQTPVSEEKTNGRLMLILLLVFFAVPLLIVFLMYQYEWHPSGQSNGDLVTPARLLEIPQGLQKQNADLVDASVWNEQWNIVYVAKTCAVVCEKQLHEMRQIHSSLAKEIERVQRVLIAESGDFKGLLVKYPDLIILSQPGEQRLALSKQFDIDGAAADQADQIYFVDPLGHLMMRYTNTIKPKAIRQDLKKLLRYSWAG